MLRTHVTARIEHEQVRRRCPGSARSGEQGQHQHRRGNRMPEHDPDATFPRARRSQPGLQPPMVRQLRPFALVFPVLAAALVLALAACGSGGGSGGDTEKLLADTFGKTTQVDSGRLKLGIDVRASGLPGVPSPMSVRLGGPFERSGEKGVPRFDFDVALATADGRFTIGIVSTGKRGWLKLGSRAFTLPAEQFEQLAPKGGDASDLGKIGVDPRGWIENVRDRGVETLAGAKVVHLSADVDLDGLADDLDKLLASAGGSGLGAIAGLPDGVGKEQLAKAVESATVDIWTGEKDHRLRRMKIELVVDTPGEDDGRVALDLGVEGLGEPQRIAAPDDPRPLSELTAALAVLGQQRARQSSGGAPGGYEECLQAAGEDLAAAQACADLLE